MFVANLVVELACEILCPLPKFVLRIRPVNFFISLRGRDGSCNRWVFPMVSDSGRLRVFGTGINLPRSWVEVGRAAWLNVVFGSSSLSSSSVSCLVHLVSQGFGACIVFNP